MTPLLLSKRQAAKLLGIGRDTLGELILGGHIRTVDLLGQQKIAREEVERFAREGTGPQQRKPERPMPRARSKAVDAILAYKVT